MRVVFVVLFLSVCFDQAEFEHYQKIEDAEREKKRKLKSQD